MATLEEVFAVGDDALILVGLLLLIMNNLWGLVPIALGLAWKYLEGEIRFSPFKKGRGEAKEETPEEFEYLEEEAEEGEGEESEGEGEEGEGEGEE